MRHKHFSVSHLLQQSLKKKNLKQNEKKVQKKLSRGLIVQGSMHLLLMEKHLKYEWKLRRIRMKEKRKAKGIFCVCVEKSNGWYTNCFLNTLLTLNACYIVRHYSTSIMFMQMFPSALLILHENYFKYMWICKYVERWIAKLLHYAIILTILSILLHFYLFWRN